MKMQLSWMLAAVLAACTPATDATSQPANGQEQPPARTVPGEYVVTNVNEAPPAIGIANSEPTVTITGDRIHFQSQCIYDDWRYTRDGEAIETGDWQYDGDIAMCARGLATGETAIIKAIDGADTVRFVPHGLWLSGKGGTVQMKLMPSDEQLAARAVDLTGEWRVAGIDGKPIDASYGIALSADFHGIWWEPGCAGQGVTYTIDGNRFAVTPPRKSGPDTVCDIGVPPEIMQVWDALRASDTIRRTAEGGVEIAGKGRSVVLFSQ